MHLTGLSNTCIDNPTNVEKAVLVDSILGNFYLFFTCVKGFHH